MSLQAMSWALDCSEACGIDRLVLIVMCHHTDEAGFCGLSRATLADESRVSESTAHRAQRSLEERSDIAGVAPEDAPAWWHGIPANRRPKLYRMSGFLGSQYATPVRKRGGSQGASPAGGSQGGRRGVTAHHDPPSDQGERDANREQRTENSLASRPNEHERTPESGCVRCRGRGSFYSATAGCDVVCSCVDTRPFVEIEPPREYAPSA